MDIMYDSIDSVPVGQQPQREVQVYYYFYYVLFIIVGAFFTLNLLVGVIVGTDDGWAKPDLDFTSWWPNRIRTANASDFYLSYSKRQISLRRLYYAVTLGLRWPDTEFTQPL